MNVVESVEAGEIARLTEGRIIPAFSAGDTVRVNVKIPGGVLFSAVVGTVAATPTTGTEALMSSAPPPAAMLATAEALKALL